MTRYLLFLIVFLALVVFFYRLGAIPPGLVRDEAALGFNAYTLSKTATDEHGKFLPLNMESFGDWKLPGYSLLLVPLINSLELSPFSIRSLSALAGIFGIIGIFLLVRQLADKKMALVSALVFSIIPWHIHFSRAAYEANLALTLYIFGFYFFERHKNHFGVLISGLFFLFTLMTYHSAHVFLPLFWLFLVFTERQRLFQKTPMVVSTLLVSILLASFVGISLLGNTTKISGIGIFSDKLAVHLNIELPRNKWGNNLASKILFNRPVYLATTVTKNFLNFFSPGFLVTHGGRNPQHNVPNSGNLTWPMYVLLTVGLILALKKKGSRISKLTLAMIAIGLIPSSITRDAPHYTRSIFALPAVVMLISAGIIYLSKKTKALALIICFVISFALFLYSQRYYFEFPDSGKILWNRELTSAVKAAVANESKYDGIIIPRPDYSPYIFVALEKNWNPLNYQSEVEYYPPTSEGFRHVKKLGKYFFPEKINDFPFKVDKKYLIIDWRDRVETYPGAVVTLSGFDKNDLFKFVER